MRTALFLALWTVCPNLMQAQVELCGDGADNDLDYLGDCADPECQCGDAYPCIEDQLVLYQVRAANGAAGNELFRFDQNGWTPLFTSTTVNGLNAIGYNAQDGWMYGIRRRCSAANTCHSAFDELYRIRNGQPWFENLGDVGLVPSDELNFSTGGFYHAGDFDLNGHLFVLRRGEGAMYKIDVADDDRQAFPIALAPAGLASGLAISDMVYLPAAGRFFGVQDGPWTASTAGQTIMRTISLNGTITTAPLIGYSCPNQTGAMFADQTGRLYGYCNGTGQLFQFTATDNTFSEFTAQNLPLGAGPSMVFNDGAACPLTNGIGSVDDCCERVLDLLEGMSSSKARSNEQTRTRESQGQSDPPSRDAEIPEASRLEQNKPNPFSDRTTIEYGVKTSAKSAAVAIFTLNGELLQTRVVPVVEQGAFIIEGRTLKPGMYLYTLIVDGSEVDTKRLILLNE